MKASPLCGMLPTVCPECKRTVQARWMLPYHVYDCPLKIVLHDGTHWIEWIRGEKYNKEAFDA